MPALVQTFALPLIVLGLVFGVPRYFPAMTEGLTDTYGMHDPKSNPEKSPGVRALSRQANCRRD